MWSSLLDMVRKHKNSQVLMTLKVQSVLQNGLSQHISSQQRKEQLPGKFSAMVQNYWSQLRKSSLAKGNQPRYHICMSL